MLNLLQLTVDKLVFWAITSETKKRSRSTSPRCSWWIGFFGESRCFLTNQTASESETKRDYAKDPCIQSLQIPQAIASRNPRDCEDHMPGPPAKKKKFRPSDQWDPATEIRNHREDLEISSYVMDTLWICYGYSNPYVFMTSLPFAFWEIWKKTTARPAAWYPASYKTLCSFTWTSHSPTDSRHHCARTDHGFGLFYVSNIWLVPEMGVPPLLMEEILHHFQRPTLETSRS